MADTPGGADVPKGIPGSSPSDPAPTVEERFWSKVQKTKTCWLWIGGKNTAGYGRLSIGRKSVAAHRYAYQLLVGPIPEGLTIDHVKNRGCTSRACVKAIADEFGPAHLEPVTVGENLLRGETFQGKNAHKTHCAQGHPFDEANTYIARSGSRVCRACNREWSRRYRKGRKQRMTRFTGLAYKLALKEAGPPPPCLGGGG